MKRLLVLGLLMVAAPSAQAITRTQVLTHAKAYAFHPWTMKTANAKGACSASYTSLFQPGDYLGLPYDWGGYMTLSEFDQQIQSGYGAGSQPMDGVLDCTSGVDCSGFVSGCWESGHFTTSTIGTTSTAITQAELLAGDVVNKAGEHVVLYSHALADGEPVYYESGGYNVHVNPFGGWSSLMGYLPRRYNSISGTVADDPVGTVTNPIVIASFPYSDSRNTTTSSSRVFDRCPLATSNESGPEYVYKVAFTQPGQLTVAVSDDAGADIDVHLYSSFNANDCVARHDTMFTQAVDCGTYYVVADTFTNGSGTALAGNYNLMVTFTPSGTACGAGPHVYATPGGPGQACRYMGHETLPFCNPTLGADTCVYSTQGSGSSFCARPCKTVADCGDYPGGCCSDLGNGELYCMPASWCGGPPPSTDPKMPPSDVGTDGGSPEDSGPLDEVDAGDPTMPTSGCAFAITQPSRGLFTLALLVLLLFALRRSPGYRRDASRCARNVGSRSS